MLEVEGGTPEWCMRILRHEAGHAIDNAFRLRRRRQRRELFGSPRRAVSGVLHAEAVQQELRAPSRPVVRAEPSRRGLRGDVRGVADARARDWRARYADWPALKKLEYMDALMQSLAGEQPLVTSRQTRRSAAAPAQDAAPALRQKRAHYGVDSPLLRPRPAPPLLRRARGSRQHDRRAVPRPASARRAPPHGGALDRRLSVHDRPGARRHDRALPGAGPAARASRKTRHGSEFTVLLTVQTMNYLHSGAAPGGAVKTAARRSRLMHDAPRAAGRHRRASTCATAEWKTEYDVLVDAAGDRPRGPAARRPRRPRRHPRRHRRVEAAHRVQPARGLRRRRRLRPERRQLPRAAARAVHRLQPARADARARQGAVEEAPRLPPHPGAGVRGLPASGASKRPPQASDVPADREVAHRGGVDRHLAGVGRRRRREAAASACEFIHESIGTDAIVERYIEGRELYVGVLGNQRAARCSRSGRCSSPTCRGRQLADRDRAGEVEPQVPEAARHQDRTRRRTCRTELPSRSSTSPSASTARST